MRKVIDEIMDELTRARCAYPHWPDDVIHQVAIMAEEAGEAVQAANDIKYHGGSASALRKELAQTAAMCIRCLERIDHGPKN